MPAYMREDQDTEEQVMTQQKLLQPHVVKVVVRQMDTEPRHALLIICHGRDVRQATNMIKHQGYCREGIPKVTDPFLIRHADPLKITITDKLQFADVKYYQMVFDQNNQKTVALKLQRHQSPDVDSKGYVSGTLKITLMEGKHKGELACPHIKLSLDETEGLVENSLKPLDDNLTSLLHAMETIIQSSETMASLRPLADSLGVPRPEFLHIRDMYWNNVKEQGYAVLRIWRETSGVEACTERLLSALNKAGLPQIAEEVRECLDD